MTLRHVSVRKPLSSADPGLDHCHNLEHARDGLIAHLAYAGVTEPYVVGGAADNEPE